MKILVQSNVVVSVHTVEVDPIIFIKDGTFLAAMTSYRWLDNGGNTIRQSNKGYTQAQLIAAAPDPVAATNILNSVTTLFVDGISPELKIRIRDDGNIVAIATHSEIINGNRTQVQTQYQESDLIAHGLSSPVLNAAIQQIIISLINS